MPSCPLAFSPQHQRVPSLFTVHVCHAPAARLTVVAIDRGVVRSSAVPSCWYVLSPQHHSEPSLWTPHENRKPVDTLVHCALVAICCGVDWSVTVPFPIWPYTLPPQHHIEL